MQSLYIIIPAYNEEENIEQCINDWYPVIENHNQEHDSCLLVIDDGSKDQTFIKLQKLAENRPLLVPLTKTNGGHGPTILYGYHYAINNGAEWIFQTDSDGQTNPEEFEQFWEKRNEYDAILGERRVRGDGRARKFVEDIVCLLLRIIFGIKVKDANAPFRLMKSELVKEYIGKIPSDFNIPNILFTTFFVYHHEKVIFLPISFKQRTKGTNTIYPVKIVKIGWKALGDFIKVRKEINDKFG